MTESIVRLVRDKYAEVARSSLNQQLPGVRAVAEAFGYTPEELATLPAEANMGLSCGNPTATAHLRPGEVVLDLGCGGGIDVILAAGKVGPKGKVIGIDMTPEMIERARVNSQNASLTNTEFHLARMESLPLPDQSVDCVISNCVINLAPDKRPVFREIFRVLKPGGRVAISDIALKQPLPEELSNSIAAYVGCIAGALSISKYERLMKEAGFEGVQVINANKDLNAYAQVEPLSGCCGTSSEGINPFPMDAELHKGLSEIIGQYDVNEYAASVRVLAVKSDGSGSSISPFQEAMMATLQVFDKPMCCSTGICGVNVDPVLPKFAADLSWLKDQGVTVERHSLSQQPQAFVDHPDVKDAIQDGHEGVLPLVRVNGVIVSKGVYPSRKDLAQWCGVSLLKNLTSVSAPVSACGPSGCC